MICQRPTSVKSSGVNSELENNPPHPHTNPAASPAEQGLQQGLALCGSQRWLEAAACFEAVIAQDPRHAIAWNNLGNVRDELGDSDGACQAFECALQLEPQYASPKKNLALVAHKHGVALYAAGQLRPALAAFQTAAAQGLGLADYDHSYLQLLLETCEHEHVTAHVATMLARTYAHESYQPHPYPLLAAIDHAPWHQLAAKRHMTRLCHDADAQRSLAQPLAPLASFPPHPQRAEPSRIRIAYLSCDWHQHPVPQQLIASIEAHDRSKFEIIGIATDDHADTSPWRARIERAFDQFHQLGHLSDNQIAEHLHRMDIDIGIDVSLYMQSGRPLILARRPCRVQVAFLGYASTSSAPWIDALIADEVVIPPSHESFYSEKIIRKAGSFMPDNDERPTQRHPFNMAAARIQQGLPEGAFVFCAFNNPYKITPDVLACWFRLLHAVPTSVLWLQANNDVTQQHLAAQAAAAGLAPHRLIFAQRLDSFDAHLQRYALADLFLDTYPYNAHVTAADSLWMGLPLLTRQGQSFASRVASSILTALDMPELITTDAASYEARAIELATDSAQLHHLRRKLARSKAAGRYFNQTHYVRGLESALEHALKLTPSTATQATPQKLIAFSLWGDNPTYLIGALRNSELAAKLYPDWTCRFYCAQDMSPEFLNQLRSQPNVQVVLMPPKPDRGGAFWRFLAAEDAHASHVLFRDTDSRLSQREVAAVNDWIASGKLAHLMRDHPFHWPPIMAGMWGCQGGALTGWQARTAAYANTTTYGSDQAFLADVVYPYIKTQCVIHDDWGLSEASLDVRPFPTARNGLEFVGQCFDANDRPNQDYEQALTPVARL